MLSFLKLVPLVLSTAALICLAMVFSACTSTSSPQNLFFMKVNALNAPGLKYGADGISKVNLTEFPKVDHPNLGRSVGIPGGDSSPLQQDNLVDSISGAAENAAGRVSGHVQDLSDRLHSLLPEYYVIGLWSYCEGKRDTQTSSNCSGPSASFSFDLVDLLSNRLGQADGVLPSLTKPVLKGYRQVSHWSVVAYVMAFITTFVAIVAGLVRFPLAKLVAIISSAVSL